MYKKKHKKERKTNAVCEAQFQIISDPNKPCVLKFVRKCHKQENSNKDVDLVHIDAIVEPATMHDDSISRKLTDSMELNVSAYLKANANSSALERPLKDLSGDLNLSN